jgi:DNA gyrase inhibitor GyrI
LKTDEYIRIYRESPQTIQPIDRRMDIGIATQIEKTMAGTDGESGGGEKTKS